MRLGGLGVVLVALASCGGSESESTQEPTPDPRQLIVRLSDLPPRFSLVAGETRPTSLAHILADPWLAGQRSELERERVAGYETSVWTPARRRIQCSVAYYRSDSGARRTLRVGAARFRTFLARRHLGEPVSHVGELGDDVHAFRFDLGNLRGLSVSWRNAGFLATCSVLGTEPDWQELMLVATAQQRRLATALG